MYLVNLHLFRKRSQTVTFFKNKGSAHDVNNYRPISITSALRKFIDKKYIQPYDYYCLENNSINKYQSGFQTGDSTANYLLEIFHTIKYTLDKGKAIKSNISKYLEKIKLWSNT